MWPPPGYGAPPPSGSPYPAMPGSAYPTLSGGAYPSISPSGPPADDASAPSAPPAPFTALDHARGPYGAPPSGFGPPLPTHYAPPPYGAQPPPYGSPYGAPPASSGFGAPPPPYAPPVAPPPYAPPAAPYAPPSHAPPAAAHKKALLVGCSYRGQPGRLNGCINDVKCMKHLLQTKFGYLESNIVVLEDEQSKPDFMPTRGNINRGIQWLLTGMVPGSSLVFHFSGHGSQVRDRTGDEADGMDETILPCDFRSAGQITDDELNVRLVRPLPPGVTLHAIVDACHSGTVLDLQYRTKVKPGKPFVWKKGRVGKGTSGGLALQFGACQDSQVAADTNKMSGSAHTGAATYSFIQAIERGGVHQSYSQVLQAMHSALLALSSGDGGGSALGNGAIMGVLSLVLSNGSGGMGGQTPVLCCDKPLDIVNTRLML